jgi:uncharacterized damage-inducible protein DinB
MRISTRKTRATANYIKKMRTYHRGQITTLLRQLGAHPPTIDYLRLLAARARR